MVLRVHSTCDRDPDNGKHLQCQLEVLERLKGDAPPALTWETDYRLFTEDMYPLGEGELLVWGQVAMHDGIAHLLLLEGHRPVEPELLALVNATSTTIRPPWRRRPSVVAKGGHDGLTYGYYAPLAIALRVIDHTWAPSCAFDAVSRAAHEAASAVLADGGGPEAIRHAVSSSPGLDSVVEPDWTPWHELLEDLRGRATAQP